jgi:pSer/pThr/pTyr-binding forkhead associated (FHA) protein
MFPVAWRPSRMNRSEHGHAGMDRIMVRFQMPYRTVLLPPHDFDPEEFDDILRECLEKSRTAPVVIEVFNESIQYLAFINEGQLYWACANEAEHFHPVKLREFFSSVRRTPFPTILAYDTDVILYHSLLVYLQKKPELKVSSALVDLEELLDRTEQDWQNAIVSASQPGVFFLLRYHGGKPLACYNGRSERNGPSANAREDFLVKVYTATAKRPLEINLFTDLTVTHAEDVRSLPSEYAGSVSSFYLSQPPRLVVRLKGRPLKTLPFAGETISIGRLLENDIVIDNLSVSRKHAVIRAAADGFVLRDLGSRNGTLLNGKPVAEAKLASGDCIMIGKYEILFQIPALEDASPDDLDQTVIIPHFRGNVRARCNATQGAGENATPCLFRKSAMEEYRLDKERTVIGRGKDSDIRLSGFFAPRVTVEVVRTGSDFVLQKVEGKVKVTINGEEMDERTLETEDLISIGSEEFVFKD